MAKLYERYLRVLKNWPLPPDEVTPLRSLPHYLRLQGKSAFSARGQFSGNAQECDRRLTSLENLTRNHWAGVYPHTRQLGALGLSADQCKFGLSGEYQTICESSKLGLAFQSVTDSIVKPRSDKT